MIDFHKLKPMVDGPFKVLEKIGENAYKIELLKEYDISPIFNVKDLRPYHGENPSADLWASLFFFNRGGMTHECCQI